MTARTTLEATGPKRLLALDGGGIRGALSIEVIARIEAMLRKELGRPRLVLADWFDFIGGTSTGAILATGLALGMSANKLRAFYQESGPAMFDKASLLRRHRYKYEKDALTEQLKTVFGKDRTLGSDDLRTLLLLVMRNATTDSPWPVSNNPAAKYNDRTRPDCNLNLPLWQLVRASTAAPTYFPPEAIQIGKHDFLFVDGGITTMNDPAFQMFLMATIPPYHVRWDAGEEKMLLVSVGTGHAPDANRDLAPSDMNLLYNAGSIPSALMAAALHEQDLLCRVFGKCLVGDPIDREVGNLARVTAPGGENLFTYLRYNAELSRRGLRKLKITNVEPEDVQQLDSTKHIAKLRRIGKAVAKSVKPEHYAPFLQGGQP